MSIQLLALLRSAEKGNWSGFTRGLSSSFHFKALRTLYKNGYWCLMNWIPKTLHRSRLDFYVVGAVECQCFEVTQSSRFSWLLLLYTVHEELSICLLFWCVELERTLDLLFLCFLKMLLNRFVCKLLLPRSHPVKHFSFPQLLCFPYFPFISVRSLCHGQACCMFSCTSARNYPCCCLLSSSWQTDCMNTLWAIRNSSGLA